MTRPGRQSAAIAVRDRSEAGEPERQREREYQQTNTPSPVGTSIEDANREDGFGLALEENEHQADQGQVDSYRYQDVADYPGTEHRGNLPFAGIAKTSQMPRNQDENVWAPVLPVTSIPLFCPISCFHNIQVRPADEWHALGRFANRAYDYGVAGAFWRSFAAGRGPSPAGDKPPRYICPLFTTGPAGAREGVAL